MFWTTPLYQLEKGIKGILLLIVANNLSTFTKQSLFVGSVCVLCFSLSPLPSFLYDMADNIFFFKFISLNHFCSALFFACKLFIAIINLKMYFALQLARNRTQNDPIGKVFVFNFKQQD